MPSGVLQEVGSRVRGRPNMVALSDKHVTGQILHVGWGGGDRHRRGQQVPGSWLGSSGRGGVSHSVLTLAWEEEAGKAVFPSGIFSSELGQVGAAGVLLAWPSRSGDTQKECSEGQ